MLPQTRSRLADALLSFPDVADRFGTARELIRAVKGRHPDIANAFGSDAGVRLMRKDAEMADRIMWEMVRETGIVPLPVHDSFIVPAADAHKLGEVMDREISQNDPDFETSYLYDNQDETSRTALAPPSPEAKRQLACTAVDLDSGKIQSGRGKAVSECFRVDAKGRILDTQYRLVARDSAHIRRDGDESISRDKRDRELSASANSSERAYAAEYGWPGDLWRRAPE